MIPTGNTKRFSGEGVCALIWSFFGTAGAKNQEGAVSSTKKLTQVAHNLFVELPYSGGSAGFGTLQQRSNCSGFFLVPP